MFGSKKKPTAADYAEALRQQAAAAAERAADKSAVLASTYGPVARKQAKQAAKAARRAAEAYGPVARDKALDAALAERRLESTRDVARAVGAASTGVDA